jgi:murein DD-endopeptidase MepM/ murein hydrolase activator NlpD
MYRELSLSVRYLTTGYYAWRNGSSTEITAKDGQRKQLDPRLNAGSAALYHLMSKLYSSNELFEVLNGANGFLALHHNLFDNAWQRATMYEPLFPDPLEPPVLDLPFLPGYSWSLTGGPHTAWGVGAPWGALDFAPATGQTGCGIAAQFITASAPGVVIRSENSVVALDLDGDGSEQTGWVIIYLHLSEKDRVKVGQVVSTNDILGHPSCEGGVSSGTHAHISRKFNGEWIGVDPELPFILSGWQAVAGEKPYQGALVKGDQKVISSPYGSRESLIRRDD